MDPDQSEPLWTDSAIETLRETLTIFSIHRAFREGCCDIVFFQVDFYFLRCDYTTGKMRMDLLGGNGTQSYLQLVNVSLAVLPAQLP